jgi:hypothetical protein
MRTWTKGTASAALFTASFVALGTGTMSPQAAFGDTTSGSSSVLGGNQINVPVSIPVNVCGNAVAVAGGAFAGCKGGAKAKRPGGGSGGTQHTSGRHSIGGGNQVNAPINVPVNVCGNAVAVIGGAAAGCKGGAKAGNPGGGYGGGQWTSGHRSILGGNQIKVPVSVPVNACGNAIGNAVAGCKGGATSGAPGRGYGGGSLTSGDHSIGGGNQITVPVKIPANVCGNAVAVLGDALAGCAGGAGGHGGHGGQCGCGGYGSRGLHAQAASIARDLPVVSEQALPIMPQQTKALGLSSGTAMPTMPQLPVQTEQLTQAIPDARTLSIPSQGKLPGLLPTPAKHRLRSVALPGEAAHTQMAPPAPGDLPGVPGNGINPPNLGGPHDPLGAVTQPKGLAPMAADDLLGGGMKAGSAYVLTVGALLAGAAAVMAFTRRIRFARR